MNGIQQIFPQTPSPAQSIADPELTDESLLAAYQPPQDQPWLSFNFVSSLDGAATVRGRSGGLGNDADQRIFKLLRCHADVILIGAQTVRVEGYTGELVDEAAQRWRERHGKPAHPPLAIVSGSLALDPTSELFTAAPVRPLIFTVESASEDKRTALSEVAEVIAVGQTQLDPAAVLAELATRGMKTVHSEGGPHLLGTFTEAGLVDELCLTVSPMLAAGTALRISSGNPTSNFSPQNMKLVHTLVSDSMLFLRYTSTHG